MGAKNSKVKKKGAAAEEADESPDQVDKTATLPASFKKKEVETGGKTETLPRNLNRSTSFTNSCRNWAKKKGLVKDKSPKDETPTKTNEDDVKENGTRKSETKETITPVVAKLAQKKARAQFFEDMYNSSGMSVSSSLTPEKPKRLCDMNLPSPRIGPGSPAMDKPKVEQIVEMIEEKEKLNRSIDSEANSSLNRSMEAEPKKEAVVVPVKEVVMETTKETDNDAVSPKEEISEEANIEVKEDLIEAAKEETDDVIETIEELQEVLEEKKNVEELQEILEDNDIGDIASNDASKAWEEAKEEMLEKVEEIGTMDETLPSTAPLQPLEPSMQTLEEEREAKEEVEEVGEVKEDVDDKECSLEEEKEEETQAMDNGELGENVITDSGAGQSSGEEDMVKEESCTEEKQGGALGLRRELESGSESEGVDGN